MTTLFENVVVVTRKTELEELIERYNTKAQAKFYLEQGGYSIEALEAAHEKHHEVLNSVRRSIPRSTKYQLIHRERVPQYMFGDDDLVVTVGQDGLVSNTAKYLAQQPIFAINPNPELYDGVLLPFKAQEFAAHLKEALRAEKPHQLIQLAEAKSSSNQTLLAFNDFFIGPRSHVSARYEIEIGGKREYQSSSGIIVSTGAGSTGWLQSIYAGAAGIVEALGGSVTPPPNQGQFPWDSRKLVYSVREPFPSRATQCSLVHGYISIEDPLIVTSKMGQNGFIFSDGVESDNLEFNAGTTLTIRTSKRQARLLSP
ncbi:MAG: hypothetical protein AAF438_04565 [Pseudomonadota bacterium]